MFAIDSSGQSLSPLNINDPLLRNELYREIRLAQTDPKYREDGEWGYYIIQPADRKFPELAAYKALSVDTLKWLILIATSVDDFREELQDGIQIWLPTTRWLRERIKYYCELEKK